ncbi:ribonuclease HII [Paenibacillus sp. WQ 127069]|uniref:Ribonuclease HII n=1 Tax=Paenibacillus baimaensis TaxID=2982185 RepID=A0ABT2UKZ6_9BACL|nr:ribonuclease HII [Paenibacillus sp. WQ 127069]MCU6795314.1 ribonuclease HII [Paenibacillus sp. WQ 127069]
MSHTCTSAGEEAISAMLEYERSLWDQGYQCIAGVDEVGRGCLFGDVVAAAVILPPGLILEDVNDSKKLSAKKREQQYELIQQEAVAISIGIVDVRMIEQINIKQASRLAMKLAVEGLDPAPDYLLVDAEQVEVEFAQQPIIHGDAVSQSIAAASIIAKVTRDRMCLEWDKTYPDYGIALHKGYATKLHREKLLELGSTTMHRKTFLKNILLESQQLEWF